jgi:hypothetical protein
VNVHGSSNNTDEMRHRSVLTLISAFVIACTAAPTRGSVGALCATDDECALGLSCRAGVCAGPADAGVPPDASADVGVPSDAGTDSGASGTDSGTDAGASASDAGRVVTYGTPCTCPGATTGCESCRPGLLCDVLGAGVPSVPGTCVDACVFTGACDPATQFCDSIGTSGGGCVSR